MISRCSTFSWNTIFPCACGMNFSIVFIQLTKDNWKYCCGTAPFFFIPNREIFYMTGHSLQLLCTRGRNWSNITTQLAKGKCIHKWDAISFFFITMLWDQRFGLNLHTLQLEVLTIYCLKDAYAWNPCIHWNNILLCQTTGIRSVDYWELAFMSLFLVLVNWNDSSED